MKGRGLVVLFLGATAVFAPESLPGPTTGQSSLILIDPEPMIAVSTAVLPAEPPQQVRLQTVTADRHQWRGAQCGVTLPRLAVFRHADKWQAFWEKGMAPFSPRFTRVPTVDFAHEMVVGVFLGEKRYPYFEVEIRSAKMELQKGGEPALVVRYHEIHRMSGVFTPEFPIQPFHLLKVPVWDGAILFRS